MAGETPLLDFPRLARRLRTATRTFGALAAVAVAVEVARGGGVAPAVLRWGSAAVAALVLTTAVLVALQAYRAADLAQGRGERLSADDVRLVPPRPRDGRDARRGRG